MIASSPGATSPSNRCGGGTALPPTLLQSSWRNKPAQRALGDVEPDEAQERDHSKDHRRCHLVGIPPSDVSEQHPGDHWDRHSGRYRQQCLCGVLDGRVIQVLSPLTNRKIAPVATIPTAMAASISKKCRQKGGRIRSWLATRGPGRGALSPWVGAAAALRAFAEALVGGMTTTSFLPRVMPRRGMATGSVVTPARRPKTLF